MNEVFNRKNFNIEKALAPKAEYVRIRDAVFPAPFSQQLEFSSPARGTWNIVHTGMLIPESHQIFVCAKGCLRGVVLTAAEMGAMGRYSALEIKEDNVLNGDMEDMMVEGVADILAKLPYSPRAILLFISCQHFFLAYDRDIVFKRLRERFPDIDFTDCYMIPTLRKSGLTPDQKMRMQEYSLLKPATEKDANRINLIGSNHKISADSEIYEIAKGYGYRITSIHDCETYDDYLEMSRASLNIVYEPLALMAAEEMKTRLGIDYIYLPSVWDEEGIRDNCAAFAKKLTELRKASEASEYPALTADSSKLEAIESCKSAIVSKSCEKAEYAMRTALEKIGDRAIAIDYTFCFRPINLARVLVEDGFNVTDIFADSLLPEEKGDFEILKAKAPDIRIHPTNRDSMRFEDEINPDALALGQKAACFMGTDNFVNLSEGGGMFGFGGVERLAGLMLEANAAKKDRRAIVQKKGCGLESIVNNGQLSCCNRLDAEVKSSGFTSSAGLIPTYSSDEFGVCSALYELGGMVVMHDASGCNSTYTTHDEPRWYDRKSMIYISALSESEAIMGDDQKLIDDICESARRLKPEFVAIVGAPIPYMMGTDLEAIAMIIENELGIPCFGFGANGMQPYTKGISMALLAFVKRYAGDDCEKLGSSKNECSKEVIEKNDDADAIAENSKSRRVNLVGATPLDFSLNGSAEAIEDVLIKKGFEINSKLGMGGSLSDYENLGRADVNLVLSSSGFKTAEYINNKLGIPYICGVPFGQCADEFAARLKCACDDGESSLLEAKCTETGTRCEPLEASHLTKAVIIGDAVTAGSLARAIEKETTLDVSLIVPFGTDTRLLREGDRIAESEDEIMATLAEFEPEVVIADPFYEAILTEKTDFVALAHEAFSGRIFGESNPNLVDCSLTEALDSLKKYKR